MDKLSKSPDDIYEQYIAAYIKWQKACGRTIPDRTHVKPQDIYKILPHIMITEHLGNGVVEYKLVGEQVKKFYPQSDLERRTTEVINTTVHDHVKLQKYLVNACSDKGCGIITHRSLTDDHDNEWGNLTFSLPLTSKASGNYSWISAIKVISPNETDSDFWSLENSFNLQKSSIINIALYDLGNGVITLPDEFAGMIKQLPTQFLNPQH